MINRANREETLSSDDMIHLFQDSELSTVIIGHLLIENILVKLINVVMPNSAAFNSDNLRFPQKVSLCEGMGLIEPKLADYLKQLNKLRNNFAHDLRYYISFEDAVGFAKAGLSAGIKYHDTDFESYRKFKNERKDVVYLLHDIFMNTTFDLTEILCNNGGEMQFE
jgi:hypothetical protein